MDALAEKRYREDREREEELDTLYKERVRGQQCPECGGALELEPQWVRVIVVCDCGWWEEAA
jgi:ssDNA-binding Zn-finger/Zn-ribbon topoisomerase 1